MRKNLRQISGIIFATLLLVGMGWLGLELAEGQEYQVKAEHPRIWLTPEVEEKLKARAAADTPQWQALKGKADIEGGSAYTYSLAYLMTGSTVYAERALQRIGKLLQYVTDPSPGGYYEGVLTSYTARHVIPEVAIGYDWIYDYLSEANKTAIINKLNEWMDFLNNPSMYGGISSYPSSNYFYGYLIAVGTTGLATYGDNPRADEFINTARVTKFENKSVPFLDTYGRGGDWFEGGYSPGVQANLVRYMLAVRTTTGEDLFEYISYPEEVIYSLIYYTEPSRSYVHTWDDWGRDFEGAIWDHRIVMLYLSEIFKEKTSGQYARWWIDRINRPSWAICRETWSDFFWYDPEYIGRSINELPLSYFAPGSGMVFSRSDWSDAATAISFRNGPRKAEHQHWDANHFMIYKKARLATDSNIYSRDYVAASYGHNTLLINDKGQEYYETYTHEGEATFEDKEGYTYMKGDATKAYHSSLLTNFVRQIVFLRPDYFVIFDRVETPDPNYSKKWLLHVLNEPQITGGLAIATSGDGKLFSQTLLPTGFSINKIDENTIRGDLNTWRIEVQPTIARTDDIFLHILQTADSSTGSPLSTEMIDSATNNMVGALIADPSGPRIAMFSRTGTKETGGLAEPITYTVSATGTSKHLIVDLKPNTQFTITNRNIDTDTVVDTKTQASSTQGTLYFETILGSNHRISITPEGQVIKGDVNGDRLVNVVDVQLAVNQFLGVQPQTQEADLNGDGLVNVIDVQLVVNIILGG